MGVLDLAQHPRLVLAVACLRSGLGVRAPSGARCNTSQGSLTRAAVTDNPSATDAVALLLTVTSEPDSRALNS